MSSSAGNGAPPEDRAPGPFDLPLELERVFALSRLPSGRHHLSRDLVEENHRNRLMAGAISSLAERGYQATTAGHIIAAAGVSNTTFYRYYPGKETCVLAAYDVAVEWLGGQISTAAGEAEGWPAKVRAAVRRALALLAAEERLARLCTIEVHFAGVRAEVRHRVNVDLLAFGLRHGRAGCGLAAELPPRLEPTLVGGAFALVARQLRAGEGPGLLELAPELTEYLLAPYLGVAAARRLANSGPA